MDAPAKRPSTTTSLRLGGMNTTTPSVGGMAETKIVTVLPLTTVMELAEIALKVFEADVFNTWLIDATLCRGIKADAISAFGALVARVQELGCTQIVLASPREEPSEGTESFLLALGGIVTHLAINLHVFQTRPEADRFFTDQRWQRLKGAI